jgi:hypothetical protein
MACALPVAASSIGALKDLLPPDALAPPGDARGLAAVAQRLFGDVAAGKENHERIANIASPKAVADALREAYDA